MTKFNRLSTHATIVWIVFCCFSTCSIVLCEEYCEYETFSPSCANDEVILIKEATYGRMKAGKCLRVPDNYPDLGCSTNVLAALTRQCSGRPSCSYKIFNLAIDHQGNCPPSTIRSYIDVTYTCLRILTPATNCQASKPVPITDVGTEGYISSYVTQTTRCGGVDNPWLLTVGEGQRINITLIDFANIDTGENEDDNNICVVYATIRDGMGTARNVVCGGRQKKTIPVFMSASNSIEIQLASKVNQQRAERQFLLKYSIEGCADPDLPDTMWVKRFPYEALVGCQTGTQSTWLLKCVRGVWEGQVGICSPTVASALAPDQPKTKEYSVNVAISKPISEPKAVINAQTEEWFAFLLKDKNVIIIAGTVMFVCLLFFILGIICVWSKYTEKKARPSMHVDHLTYGCKDYSYARPLPPSYNLHTSTRHSMLPKTTVQSTTYAFSDTSSAYNTISQLQPLSTRDHIYESTFAPSIVTAHDDEVSEGTTSEHKYFVLDPNYVSNK